MKSLLPIIIVFTFLFSIDSYAGKWGKSTYLAKDEGKVFGTHTMDSLGNQYFTGSFFTYGYFKLPKGSDTWEYFTHVNILDSTYKIRDIWGMTHGKKSRIFEMIASGKGFYGQDSGGRYIVYESPDTTIAWRYKDGDIYKWGNPRFFLYRDGKYWLMGGNVKKLTRFDENTLEIDTLPFDDVVFKPSYYDENLVVKYKEGLLYYTYDRKYLHYYSKEEYFSINIDSICKARNYEHAFYSQLIVRGDTAYLADEAANIFICDLKTRDFVKKEQGMSAVIERTKSFADSGKVVDVELSIMQNGDFFFFCLKNYTNGPTSETILDIHTFQADAAGAFNVNTIFSPEMSAAYRFYRTPYDYYWVLGPYVKPDSDTAYVICPYYPDETGVEGLPTILAKQVYPNPSKVQTKVEFYVHPDRIDKLSFTIYNYMGEEIDRISTEIDYDYSSFYATKTIDATKYSTGIYYLLIDNGIEKRLVGFAIE